MRQVAFAPGGRRVLALSIIGELRSWDLVTGHMQPALAEGVRLFSPNEEGQIAITKWNDAIEVRSPVEEYQSLEQMTGSLSPIESISFSPDGTRLASGSWQECRIWDVVLGELLIGITGGGAPVAYTPDGSHLVITGNDLRILDAATAETMRELQTATVSALSISSDGHWLAAANSGSIDLWNLDTFELGSQLQSDLWQLAGSSDRVVNAIGFSPDGASLLTAHWDIAFWDPFAESLIATRHPHDRTASVHLLAVAPDGRVAVESSDGGLIVWDVVADSVVELIREEGEVNCVAFSPDGGRLVSGGEDRTIRIWDPVAGSELLTLAPHNAPVSAVAFGPNGQRIASGATDGELRIWSSIPQNQRAEIRAEADGVRETVTSAVEQYFRTDLTASEIARLIATQERWSALERQIALNAVLRRSWELLQESGEPAN